MTIGVLVDHWRQGLGARVRIEKQLAERATIAANNLSQTVLRSIEHCTEPLRAPRTPAIFDFQPDILGRPVPSTRQIKIHDASPAPLVISRREPKSSLSLSECGQAFSAAGWSSTPTSFEQFYNRQSNDSSPTTFKSLNLFTMRFCHNS